MKNIPTLSKYFAFISLSAGAVWLGSYITRLFSVYNLFNSPELTLKSFITNQNIDGVVVSLLPVIITPFIAFIVMLLSFLLFIITSKINLRSNGWLFIILVAVIITMPFEIYLMTIDYKTILLLTSSTIDANQVITLLKDRITVLSSFPIVIILTYFSFFFFIVFQPLKKSD
ncbi:MAG: hypothetical protein WAV89_04250 [Ignavibacteriaceae bacterium]